MIFRHSGMSGDFLGSLAYVLQYFPKEHHTMILTPNDAYVSWPGHEHAGKAWSDEDIANWSEYLAHADIEVVTAPVAESRGITMEMITDLDCFRKAVDVFNGDILFSYRISLGIPPLNPFNIDKTGWLQAVNKTAEINDKIVINRTFRYRTDKFNYKALESIKNKCVFIGSDTEYDDFCKTFFKVERKICKSIVELTSFIDGCKAYVGNQSFLFWIAEGYAKPRFIETWNPRCGLYTNNGFSELNENLVKEYMA